MAKLFCTAANVALISVLAGGAAQAVTADEVWDAWSKQYASYGYNVAVGADQREGDARVLRNVTLSWADDTRARVEMVIPEVRLQERSGGVVDATFAPEITGTMVSTAADAEPVTLDFRMTHSDTLMKVTGKPGKMDYDLASGKVKLDMDSAGTAPAPEGATDAAPLPPTKITFEVEDVKGGYHVEGTTDETVTSDVSASVLRYTSTAADPEQGASFNMSGDVVDLKMTGKTFMPEGTNLKNLDTAFANGAQIDATIKTGAANTLIDGTNNSGPIKIASKSTSGNLDFALGAKGIRYAGGGDNYNVSFQGGGIPMPVNVDMKSALFDFAFPTQKSDAFEPFISKISLIDLSFSDEIWAMFDPQAKLPRDPATLILDLTGKARTKTDLLSQPAPEAGTPPEMPYEVESVDVNQLKLSMVGAQLDGKGAVTFDNSQPVPVPEGAFDLSLQGANALMDNLTALGFVPQDQMMFVRMMLGLYAVQAGDDHYTSKVELKTGGEILANGQRIR